MAKIYSFSVPDDEIQLITILDNLKKDKILSSEVVRRLKISFSLMPAPTKDGHITKEMLEIQELKMNFAKIQKMLNESIERLQKLEEHELNLKKKQEEIKEQERQLEIIKRAQKELGKYLEDDYVQKKAADPSILKGVIVYSIKEFAAKERLPQHEALEIAIKLYPWLESFREKIEEELSLVEVVR